MKEITRFTLLGLFYLVAISIYAQNNRPATTNAQDNDIFYHTVENGQTVYSIAKMYDVMLIDIYKLNPGSEDKIKIGERLKIPQKNYAVKSILNVSSDNDKEIIHTIQAKETIYGVSKLYNLSEEAILRANPGLSKDNFPTGKKIRIPKSVTYKPLIEIVDKEGRKEVYYTVPSGDTITNICRKFKTTEGELLSMNPELAGGLRAGMTIRMPLRVSESELSKDNTPVQRKVITTPPVNRANMIRIAVLLSIDTEKTQLTDATKRFIEYYEGFLLSIDTLRKQGYSIELFVYEIGEENLTKTRRVLQDNQTELANAHLIIGGNSNEQIKLIANFAKQNKVKYVIPISRNDETSNNPLVFQVNTPPSFLYEKVAYAGANLFAKYNIIFLDTKEMDASADQSEFIKVIQQELKDRNISYREAAYDASSFEENIKSHLSTSKPNMIMPVSQSLDALKKIKSTLRLLSETQPEYNLTLFGYPIWQTYFNDNCLDCLEDFHTLNTFIYSYFYTDNFHPSVKAFYEKYKSWYNKSPIPVIPKYSLSGYDMGMFFVSAIQLFGSNFEERLSEMNYKSLQTGFNFERINETGGFINKNIYIIHYNKDYTITRQEYK